MRKPSIGILHFTCPPVVGGVEAVVGATARLFAGADYRVQVLAGRGDRFDERIPVAIVPELDSKHPDLLAVNEDLDGGKLGAGFQRLSERLRASLRDHVAGLDFCIVHNAFTLHFNLPLTAALHELVSEPGFPRVIAWCHDLSWTNPLYIPKMRDTPPWNLLKKRIPGVQYVVVSQERLRELAALFGLSPMPTEPLPSAVCDDIRQPADRVGATDSRPPIDIVGATGSRPLQSAERPDTTANRCNVEEQEPLHVVPNGVDPAIFCNLTPLSRQIAEAHDLFAQDLVLLLPARLTARKNVELAIEVTGRLVRRGFATRLIVTGPPGPHNVRSGDYVSTLLALRRDLGLAEQVVFLYEMATGGAGNYAGNYAIGDEVIADLYQLADLLFFPSAQEGFGIPLLEAGLARLPVFCSDIPPFKEVGGGDVHFFSLGDGPDRIADAIVAFARNDRSYRLRKRVLRQYTWPAIFKEKIVPLLRGGIEP